MELAGTTALVTGGARRLGRAICLELARAGCDIIVHFHESLDDAVTLQQEIATMGKRAFPVKANLADESEIHGMLRTISDECPPVDILVNSASKYYPTPLAETTPAEWDLNLHINLSAPFLLSQHLGLEMVRRGRGKIINITDCSIRRPYRNFAPYLVSKAGLMALTEVLALELAPHVQVNSVAPGTVLLPDDATAEQRDQCIRRAPLKKIGNPQDVASMVRYLIEHGDFMTGGYYAVDGGAGSR